jgi:hypothetical protein
LDLVLNPHHTRRRLVGLELDRLGEVAVTDQTAEVLTGIADELADLLL